MEIRISTLIDFLSSILIDSLNKSNSSSFSVFSYLEEVEIQLLYNIDITTRYGILRNFSW